MTTQLRFVSPSPAGTAQAVALRFGVAPVGPPVDEPIDTPTLGTGAHAAVAVPWRRAAAAPASLASVPWRRAAAAPASLASVPWQRAAAAPASLASAPWQRAIAAAALARAAWARGSAVAATASTPWGAAVRASLVAAAPWGRAEVRRADAAVGWGRAAVLSTEAWAAWRDARREAALLTAAFRDAERRSAQAQASWRAGAGVYSDGAPWTLPGVPPTPAPGYAPLPATAVALRFTDPRTGLARLLFGSRRALALVRVPVREVYVVTNSITLSRLSDGAEIPVLGMSLSLDADSWAWGFSASLPATALSLIEPPEPGEPCVLQATVNGTPVRVAVESIGRERAFGSASVRISGRGISAALADPYAATEVFRNTADRTSQQLLDDALPAGWDAEWGLTAWLVPAGIWSHQGTPMTAALAIAAAGGGYVQPHNTLQRLRVLPRYPVAPWEWSAATPDIELPSAVTVRESIEWVEKARYNRVYVSGISAGVRGRVTRAGTAGDVLAPMVADALTTHADAARQRGLAVLADTGRQANVTLRLPVLAETGLITPGRLVRYVDGATTRVGLTRSISVEAAPASAWQTIRIETHVG